MIQKIKRFGKILDSQLDALFDRLKAGVALGVMHILGYSTVFGILGLLVQSFFYLRDGYWKPLSFASTLNVAYIDTSYIGFNKIVNTIFDLNVFITSTLVALVVLFLTVFFVGITALTVQLLIKFFIGRVLFLFEPRT